MPRSYRLHIRPLIALLGVLALFAVAPRNHAAATPRPPAGRAFDVPASIPALDLTAARGPAAARNPKIESHLAGLVETIAEQRRRGMPPSSATDALPEDVRAAQAAGIIRTDGGARVQIYVTYDGDPASTTALIAGAGGTVQAADPATTTIQAEIDVGALDALASEPPVRAITPPDYIQTSAGSVNTQGDALLKAADARAALGVDGAGVRVGVISDGMNGSALSQASGDLPPSITSRSFRADRNINAGAEGTAMMEVVHDLAPGAELWFANAATTVEFANAVTYLAANVDVVVDDLSSLSGPYDGTGTMAAASAANSINVANRERVHLTAAGNAARDHYQGAFVDSGFTINDSGRPAPVQRWQSTATTTDAGITVPCTTGSTVICGNAFALPPAGSATIVVTWDDPWTASTNDYDAFVQDLTAGTKVDASTNRQTGSQAPQEIVTASNTTAGQRLYALTIAKYAGASKTFDIFLRCSPYCLYLPGGTDLNYNTLSSSIPQNPDAGGNVLALAAIDQADPGTDDAEPYSSRGPTNDGRNKPDITAVDGVAVTANGGFFNPFFGTSAAAPHAAAITALTLQCVPALKAGDAGDTPATDRASLRARLTGGLVDLGATGIDTTYGAGRMDALASTTNCDSDQDTVINASDNCPNVANQTQRNTDSDPLVTAGVAVADTTRPMSDKLGDACDPDIDNDGLPNAAEAALGPGGADHALCPAATANTDPATSDTDGDLTLDGAECALGFDPADPGSRPPKTVASDADGDGLTDSFEATIGSNPNVVDTDGDGIADGVEYKAYGTSPILTNSDGDACPDGREIASVNNDTNVNSLDLLLISLSFARADRPALDINKDGISNSLDLLIAARLFGAC
ncbi:MAG: S8 family serine peptidase [Chloroflexi bacterium]|nr:S8 family serine peptidase [Chloroflexota bacterium]